MKRVSRAIAATFLLATLVAPAAICAADWSEYRVMPAGGAPSGGALKYSITVSSFENKAGYTWYWNELRLGDAWGTVMTDMLNQTDRFIVLGETDMRNEAMAEQDFGASGRTAQGAKTPEMGQMTPAQLLVKGAITHVQDNTKGGGGGVRIKGFRIGAKGGKAEMNATVYVVDSTTGMVVASKSVVGEAGKRGGSIGYSGRDFGGDVGGFKNDNVGQAMEAAIAEAIDWMVKDLPDLPWTGSVVTVRDGKVYINRGSRDGVTSGMEFVLGQHEVLRDPDTGEVLDEAVSEQARLRVDSVKDKLAICSVVSGSLPG